MTNQTSCLYRCQTVPVAWNICLLTKRIPELNSHGRMPIISARNTGAMLAKLASIGSMNESKAVFTFLKQFSADKVWLGASTSLSPVANAYSAWSDGSPMRFADFIPLDNPPDQSVDLAKSLCVAMETRPDSKYPGQFWSMDCNTR
ncbi:hypothetical protein BOX15_Mlig019801g2, partial [Macrostomum lignano]